MKKISATYFLLFLLSSVSLKAQTIISDSVRLRTWHVASDFVERNLVVPDTIPFNFQIINPIFRESIGNNYNGNIGSPYLSQLYFNRNYQSNFIFIQPYNIYTTYPNNFYFYNTKGPYTNFSYWFGGSQLSKDEVVDFMFTQNITRRWNVAASYKQTYGRGQYSNQATNHLGFDFSTNYISETYNMYLLATSTNLKNRENGGILNDIYITDPEQTGDNFTDPRQIPVNLTSATSKLKNNLIYLGQSYNINTRIKEKGDSTTQIVPFATISHSLIYESNKKTFTDPNDTSYFIGTLGLDTLISSSTDDKVNYLSLKNTLAIDINEKINRWAKFGMGGFIEYENRKYQTLKPDTSRYSMLENSENYTVVGGRIYKTSGSNIHYKANARLHLQGAKAGDFNLNGTINTHFKIFKRFFGLNGGAEFSNTSADYLQNHYYSNYFQWDNSFDNILKTKFNGEIVGFPNHSRLYASIENVKNYIYFGNDAKPTQTDENIQVIQVGTEINLKLTRNIHFDNHIVFQQSSNEESIPLPKFTSYSNLYYTNFWFNVLTVQLGVEARYFTSYYAPSYMVPTGQYYTQNTQTVGAFPVISPYANFHLKRMRFFFKLYHFNDTSNPNYFTSPHYPLDPSFLKIGFSWNFYS